MSILNINNLNLEVNRVDGVYKLSPYLDYVIANFAKEFFKEKILKLDKNGLYVKRTIVEEVPKEDLDFELSKFSKENNELSSRKKEWANNHKDYYRIQTCLPSSNIFQKLLPSITILSAEDAVQGYKRSNEILKLIPNTSLDEYCIEKRPMLNYEHREEYNNFVVEQQKILKIPTTEELLNSLLKKSVEKTRISLDRSKCVNNEFYENYQNSFIQNLLNSRD